MKIDFQWVIAILLLGGAIFYVYRSVKKSFTSEHNCPDCDVSGITKKAKKSRKTT